MSERVLEYPDRLPGYGWLEARHYGPLLAAPPTLVVLHRPASSLSVAEYFHNSPDGRKVSTHFAPSGKLGGGMVQCVSLRRVAWGQGGGVWAGEARLNARAVSIEAPVPMAQRWPRSGWQTDAVVALLRCLADALPSLCEVIGHVDCDPLHRRDPGPDCPWEALLSVVPGWASPHRSA